jgi:response regulator RpfG family c-di-GMP phosphodiesterase
MSDDLVFSDELVEPAHHRGLAPWQVLVVDDEPAVHEVTKLVMSDFEMDGRKLQFTHCYSAAEARTLLAQRSDIALILLDVVMESEHAGLDLARYIREDLRNLNVRIVLRTGQPGQAPEEQVIKDYDINDYKEKTDLTRRKLITVFYAGLRAYRDLMRIEHARAGLRRSIEAISHVYDAQNLRSFASAVLEQVNFLLDLNGEGLCASRISAYTANAANGHIKVLAVTEAYSNLMVDEQLGNLPDGVQVAIKRAFQDKATHHGERHYAGYFRTKAGSESLIYMEFAEPVNDQARELLEIFSRNVAGTYDTLLLREETDAAQLNAIAILGGAIEKKTHHSLEHLQRVGHIAALLAEKSGLDDKQIELLRVAATLHDVGKSTVADSILTKPGPLNAEEWAAMKNHTVTGKELMSQSECPLHVLAAQIAQEHHERWDGTGYPAGLQGKSISLAGRIVAIADVLDSLVNESAYKPAWPLQKALDYLHDEAGKHFDPALIALLEDNLPRIRSLYSGNTQPPN